MLATRNRALCDRASELEVQAVISSRSGGSGPRQPAVPADSGGCPGRVTLGHGPTASCSGCSLRGRASNTRYLPVPAPRTVRAAAPGPSALQHLSGVALRHAALPPRPISPATNRVRRGRRGGVITFQAHFIAVMEKRYPSAELPAGASS